jgi:hypothetical protein
MADTCPHSEALLSKVIAQPNVITLQHDNTTVYVIGTVMGTLSPCQQPLTHAHAPSCWFAMLLADGVVFFQPLCVYACVAPCISMMWMVSGAGQLSPQLESFSLQQISSLVLSARPQALVVESCPERLKDEDLAAYRASPALLATALEQERDVMNAPFLTAIHDAMVTPEDVLQRQMKYQARMAEKASHGGSFDLLGSLSHQVPADFNMAGMSSEKIMDLASNMLSQVAHLAGALDPSAALAHLTGEPGASPPAKIVVVATEESVRASVPPQVPLPAVLARAAISTRASASAGPLHIVRGDRPLSVTLNRLQNRDLVHVLWMGLKVLAQRALAPIFDLKARFQQAQSDQHLEEWLLSHFPFPIDEKTLTALRPLLLQLWWV